MAMLGTDDYLCEACGNFDRDGIDGNTPSCRKQRFAERQRAVRLGERCPYGYKFGVPSCYPVHMELSRERAHKIVDKLCEMGIEVGE